MDQKKRQYDKEYYQRNREKRKEDAKNYYHNCFAVNKSKMKQKRLASKEWREANPERMSELKKTWSDQHPEKIQTASKKQRLSCKQAKEKIKMYYRCMNPKCPCTGDLPSYCYDFHHLGEKLFDLGCTNRSIKSIIAEVNKCIVLCAICHRMETWGELNVSDFPKCNINESFFVV